MGSARVVIWAIAVAVAGTLTGARGAEAQEKLPEFRQVPPLAGVREAAKAAGFQLEGFAPARRGEKLLPGDTATLLVTLTEGKNLKQWVIELESDSATPAEAKEAPESKQFYTSTGDSFTLGGGRAALNLRVTGPFSQKDGGMAKSTAPVVQKRRVLVSPDFLGLGLDRLPAFMLRKDGARKANPGAESAEFSIAQKPYPPEVIAAAKGKLERTDKALRTSLADEVGFVGSLLAMQEFMMAANSTPGLQEVLRSVLNIPWWSIIGSGGQVNLSFTTLPQAKELPAAPWGVRGPDKIYALPMKLDINGKPGVFFQLAVTRPRPPLTVSAGALGFAAAQAGGKGPVLTFQVVSTRTRAGRR